MNAHVAAPEQSVAREFRTALAGLLQSILATVAVMLWFVAAWMLVRRLTGQLQQPLGIAPLLLVAFTLAALCAALRLGWRATASPPHVPFWLAFLVPVPALLMLAGAISMPGTSPTALVIFWCPLVVTESVWWYVAWRCAWIRPPRRATRPPSPDAHPGDVPSDHETADEPLADLSADDPDDGEWLAEGMTQQLSRIDAPDGTQTIAGVLRGQFKPGERSQSLHVAFCPPLATRPEISVTQLAGARSRIKAADVQSYGVRFDVRLGSFSDRPEEVLLHFEAVSKAKAAACPSDS